MGSVLRESLVVGIPAFLSNIFCSNHLEFPTRGVNLRVIVYPDDEDTMGITMRWSFYGSEKINIEAVRQNQGLIVTTLCFWLR